MARAEAEVSVTALEAWRENPRRTQEMRRPLARPCRS